jgi:Protein ENHANCED DISEASE RESISTANCE 2, C-terminal
MASIRSVGRRSSLNIGSPEPYRSRSAERTRSTFGEALELNFEEETEEIEPACSREHLPADSSLSSQVKSHRRAMSDPFDNPELDVTAIGTEEDHGLLEEKRCALPSLQRYPFAETNNRNCWSEPPSKIFSVRGPGYLSDKKKVTAQKYLLSARGCDLFLSDKPGNCDMGR